MIITLNNTSGFISKRVKLGNNYFNLSFTYNHRDTYWYFDCQQANIIGKRVILGRPLFINDYGYLVPITDVSKTGLTQLEWTLND